MKFFDIQSDADLEEVRAFILKSAARGSEEESPEERRNAVAPLIEEVRQRGDEAVAEFTRRFDGVDLEPSQFELTAEEIDSAWNAVPKPVIAMLERAHENIRSFHAKHLR